MGIKYRPTNKDRKAGERFRRLQAAQNARMKPVGGRPAKKAKKK